MVARATRKSVDKAQAEKYRRVGASLLESATVLSELATDADSFGNAIAVVAVHACIAYNDALSIAWKGVKSTEGGHAWAADTLVFALGHLAAAEQVRRLETVLSHKDQVSYQGSYFRVSEAARLLELAAAFCAWAERIYDRRPAR